MLLIETLLVSLLLLSPLTVSEKQSTVDDNLESLDLEQDVNVDDNLESSDLEHDVVVDENLKSSDLKHEPIKIMTLTEDNFDHFLTENPTAFIMFHSPECPRCSKLLAEFEKAADELLISFATMDIDIDGAIATRFEITKVPTLRLWLTPENSSEYDGDGTSQDIVRWIARKIDPQQESFAETVVALTAETFDEYIRLHPLVLVEFYAPWCGHCQKLAPQFEQAARMLKVQNIMLAKVDATVEKSLAEDFGIKGYPTIKIIRSGKRLDYKGPRDARGIVEHMINEAQPAIEKLTSVSEVNRFLQKYDVTVIGFLKDENSRLVESIEDAAEMTRTEFKIGLCFGAEISMHFKVNPNQIVVFFPEIYWSKYEPRRVIFDKEDATAEDIMAFLKQNSAPLVGQITQRNSDTLYAKFPLVVVYYDIDFSLDYRDGTQYWRNKACNIVLDIANMYKDKYQFAIGHEHEFSATLRRAGLDDSGLEQNVIAFGYDGSMYPMDPDKFDGSFDENFASFMKKLSSGQIKAHVKSSPVPEDDKGPVKVAVGSNFAQIVYDESKDVLVELYAPWCAHCKAFEPLYRQLAAKLQKEEPNLLLVKMDATVNDAPKQYAAEGFPAIYFAPSGQKQTPIKYEGERNSDAIISFMKMHSMVSFKTKEEL